MKLLLISNSSMCKEGYLDHCIDDIKNFLGTRKRIAFIPFAATETKYESYVQNVRERLAPFGVTVTSVMENNDPIGNVRNAEAVFVGGGNTFRLVKKLYETELMNHLRVAIKAGLPYIGTSAGTTIAGLSMKTSNDMPIVFPPSFETLGLVPLNINPHYPEPETVRTSMAETRDERLKEFLDENDVPVLALPEGSILLIENQKISIINKTAKLFHPNCQPRILSVGTDRTDLLFS